MTKTVPFEVRRIAGRIGAEVTGLKLSGKLDRDTFSALERALLEHKVLFLRGQDHLDNAEHEAFGALFGKVIAHPTVPAPKGTKILELDATRGGGRADSWHTDVTFVDAFPKISILRSIVSPEYGGDTVWANSVAAYEQLSEPLKQLAEQLWAVHSNDYDYAATRTKLDDVNVKHHENIFLSAVFEAEHPLVHVHPQTGERSLLLGHFVKRLVGLPTSESSRIFEILQNRSTRIDNTVRWRWQAGDVAIWDNRSTQHYAINDYGDQHRLMRRVTIEGEPAVSIHGERSRTRKRPEAVNDDSIRAAIATA
ncbi:TauD/TfdA dioxygenase family protein [Kaistia granuli]|uniref:TauD/TfdA dioxygenase family protein n=1 Tax=Kaistia granuli TaxID=363259 RepID=UPI000367EB73|nr:TauD/TfdA family dioxygenase [Kaistia granuli]